MCTAKDKAGKHFTDPSPPFVGYIRPLTDFLFLSKKRNSIFDPQMVKRIIINTAGSLLFLVAVWAAFQHEMKTFSKSLIEPRPA